MRRLFLVAIAMLWLTGESLTFAQSTSLQIPKKIEAGSAFSISTSGSGKATLYIVGPTQVLRRDLQLGDTVSLESGDLHNAGHYVVVLSGSSTETTQIDVLPKPDPSTMSFLAKPSRIPVNLSQGISGVTYVFDTFQNLILKPTPVAFKMSDAAGGTESRTEPTHDGVAWVKMNSAPKAGPAQFNATAGSITEKRVVQQVPAEPCRLRMTARPAGQEIELQTDPVRDCTGNPVPDGTIVSFTENYQGQISTVDVPLKRGIAKTALPAHAGASISVATGVVLGNEIRWGGGR